MSDSAARTQRRNLRWLTRGRADTLVLLGPELRDPSRFNALAVRLCLDPGDIQAARNRAADCAHPHALNPDPTLPLPESEQR